MTAAKASLAFLWFRATPVLFLSIVMAWAIVRTLY